MKNDDNIIGYDFEGWPVKKMTLKELLEALGVVDYKLKHKRALDEYPLILTDDGMGYGVGDSFIVDASVSTNGKIKIFIDKEDKNL